MNDDQETRLRCMDLAVRRQPSIPVCELAQHIYNFVTGENYDLKKADITPEGDAAGDI